ncbi:hypothetical protein AMJ83_07240 [candidate division WOR_3 bacterium SM23_42]|uniref:Uncharacterized protein n=1 Tax=candidate division WOR_3 bacterium SM23_42 TaxID=1703779 RepID=A0A0S8FS34_UNCW3|nr:MAG: hypothetical protein AMJ83_07240 [candidate division WOR_3 bacterium SM23_42]
MQKPAVQLSIGKQESDKTSITGSRDIRCIPGLAIIIDNRSGVGYFKIVGLCLRPVAGIVSSHDIIPDIGVPTLCWNVCLVRVCADQCHVDIKDRATLDLIVQNY